MSKQKKVALGSPLERFTRSMFTRIISELARSLRDQEMSVTQVAALHLLDEAGALRMSALAERLALSPSVATRLADSLVERGLVERAEDPADRRARTLALTKEGRAFVDRASEGRVRAIVDQTSGLPRELAAGVMALVERFMPGRR